jgi:aspartyl-tRNA(Asn)/glutamyl-tRNA(Gln) amidotransferase subunit B
MKTFAQQYPEWELVIGLETHVQLKTKSKIFSNAPTEYGAMPNHHVYAVDAALPGTLPVMNREAVQLAIRFGLAIGAQVAKFSQFDRKNYFYPDLPKGYQISQDAFPVVVGGEISFTYGHENIAQTVSLVRAHLEEDAGKSVHGRWNTGIDLNRAGTPLLEIVSHPDLRSAQAAAEYMRTLHTLVTWIDICDGNLQEGSMRCDANVSVRKKGDPVLGTRCEIKNLNSFKFLEKAIESEAKRQIEILEEGGTILQQTRLYNPETNETKAMRDKANAFDYRYFPDPDLPPLIISEEEITTVQNQLPELPHLMKQRLMKLGFSEYDASFVTSSRAIADFFTMTAQFLNADFIVMKMILNLMMGEISNQLKRQEDESAIREFSLPLDSMKINPQATACIVKHIQEKKLVGKGIKDLLIAIFEGENKVHTSKQVEELIEAKGLKTVHDDGALKETLKNIITQFPEQVEQYRSGNEKIFGFLMGKAMRELKGKGDAGQVTELLIQLINDFK